VSILRAVWIRNVAQEPNARGRYGLKYKGETGRLGWGISPHRKPTKRIKPTRNVANANGVPFQFYDNSSQGINSPQGLTAGAYTFINLNIFLPTIPGLLFADFLIPAESHLLRKHKITPFIGVDGKRQPFQHRAYPLIHADSLRPALHRTLRRGEARIHPSLLSTLMPWIETRTVSIQFNDNSSQGINSPQAFVAEAFTAHGVNTVLPWAGPSLLSEDLFLPAEPPVPRRHEATPFISVYSKDPR